MNGNDELRRILIAVTESSPLSDLWRAAVAHTAGSPVEIVAVFVTDERWRRAASLPFTREISRASGSTADFTAQRAEALDKEAASRARREIQRLATEADLQTAFEVLSEFDRVGIEQLIGVGESVLIAPSSLTTRPIYAELRRLKCRIHVVGPKKREGHD